MTRLRQSPTDRHARIAVLDDYMGVAHHLADWSVLEDRADITFLTDPIAPDAMIAALQDYDALCLLRERSDFPGEVLHGLSNLKALAITGRRNRTLDSATAAELGIPVMTTEGSGNGVFATVELAWGLAIGLLRHIPAESAAMRDGAWQTRLGSALYGQTLGLVGLGNLGSRMALIAKAFGMNVIAWSPNLTPDRARDGGVEYVDKETLFRTADIVSVHMVLAPSTRGIVGVAELGQMKPDAVLINTARGPLVDGDALMSALTERRIAGAGIDVYDHEPLPANHPLRTTPGTMLTPHLGYCVRETFAAFYGQSVDNLDGWLNGAPKRLLDAP
jgi:phosphoglycerate dehydrogenase-like enzyme